MTVALEVRALPVGVCSCGCTDCPEMGWPHEWNPDLDDCVICGGALADPDAASRYGSGYAHDACADPPSEVETPMLWEGDQA